MICHLPKYCKILDCYTYTFPIRSFRDASGGKYLFLFSLRCSIISLSCVLAMNLKNRNTMKHILCAFTIMTLTLICACTKSEIQERSSRVNVTYVFKHFAHHQMNGIRVNLFSIPDTTIAQYLDTTDQDGKLVFSLPTDSIFRADVWGYYDYDCYYPNKMISMLYGPFLSDTTIIFDTLNFIGPTALNIPISGRVLDCNGNPIRHGLVRVNGAFHPGLHTNANGYYNGVIPFCPDQLIQASTIVAFDSVSASNGYQTVSINQTSNTIPDISTCTPLQVYFASLHTSTGSNFQVYNYSGSHAPDSIHHPNRREYRFWFSDKTVILGFMSPDIVGLGVQKPLYAKVLDQTGQNGYACIGDCDQFSLNFTTWESNPYGKAEGSFFGTLPVLGNPAFPFNGTFSGKFHMRK